jgi:hypothetical protein
MILHSFRLLECLDISFNYFGTEDDVSSVVDLPRLKTVLLYGNPVLGPSGEDSHKIYIDDLVATAQDARIARQSVPLEASSEILITVH